MGDRRHRRRRNSAGEQAMQDVAAARSLAPISAPPDLFKEVEKAEAGTKASREKYLSCANKAENDLTMYLQSRLRIPMAPRDVLDSLWTAAVHSRRDAQKARGDYYEWCQYKQTRSGKLRKETLEFFMKEMNSLGAVVRTLQDEDMSRRRRETPAHHRLLGILG